jgi:hypothetical protein
MDAMKLEKEISDSKSFLIRKTIFKNLREQKNHEGLQKRHDVLILIRRLRLGEISMADFESQVRFFN